MKVILLDNIGSLGSFGAEIIVKPGYARNFLIPKSKAIVATASNIKKFKEEQLKLQAKVLEKRNYAKSCAEAINTLKCVTIKAKSGSEGKLFGSVGSRDIVDAIMKVSDLKVFRSQVRLPNNDVLKKIGTYSIKIHIYDEIFAILDVVIIGGLH